jgi:enediyne biosynthesis protein E4
MAERSDENDLIDEEERDDAVIGTAIRYSLFALLLILLTAGSVIGIRYYRRQPEVVAAVKPIELPTVREEVAQELPKLPWTDITDTSGITFVHDNGAAGEKLLPETMGGGCGFIDYDGDGDQDILFVNSKPWQYDLQKAQGTTSETTGDLPTLALYQNDGQGKFVDVTEASGLNVSLFGQGCAFGDFDNDGDIDIFISAVAENVSDGVTLASGSPGEAKQGPNRLFQNENGKFTDVTETAGVSGGVSDWSSSCGWFDYDNDSDLDLWVCNYIQWSREFDLQQNFRLTGGQRAYGRPQAFGGSYPRLYKNLGDGKFEEVSEQAGLRINAPTTGTPLAKSLGLTFHDFDADGNLDVLVANDTVQNNLFRNVGDGTFREIAAIAGVAFDAEGNARGAMGLDVACVRDDPRCACVAIGNFANEMTAFYVSAPNSLVFSDQAVANGLGPSTRLFLTFGVFFFDADLDGWEDVFHANGHLEEDIAKVQASQTYEQSPQLFWNAGPESATEFVSLPASSLGDDLGKPMVGRGAAYADIDGDGDLDVLVAATGAKPRLLRNEQQLGHQSLRIKLTGNGKSTNRDAIGAKVELTLESGRKVTKVVNPTRSYLSQAELPLTFGLGGEKIESSLVSWPDGKTQSFEVSPTERLLRIEQAE